MVDPELLGKDNLGEDCHLGLCLHQQWLHQQGEAVVTVDYHSTNDETVNNNAQTKLAWAFYWSIQDSRFDPLIFEFKVQGAAPYFFCPAKTKKPNRYG